MKNRLRQQIKMAALLGAAAWVVLLSACGGGGGVSAASTPVPTPPTTSSYGLQLPSSGLRAAELGVIVVDGDALSESIGQLYLSLRGVPAANLIRVKLNTASDVISAADFAALKSEVDQKLPSGVQATVLTWTSPSRVQGPCAMSITSALAFGYDAKYCGSGCANTQLSPYYDSESRRPWTDHQMRPAMMLGARTVAAARELIERGLRADASQPMGEGFLLRTSDADRSARYPDYIALPAAWAGRLKLNYLDNAAGGASNSIQDKRGVLFYFTGLETVPGLASLSFAPGAAADHLTSFGGQLPGRGGQMTALAWLDAGATASYGTVEEPCNFPQKFSRASVLIDQYYRGASLIEAYWKSVQWPGQGLFVGEPLARPFPDTPSFKLEAGAYQISSRALRVDASYSLEYQIGSGGEWLRLARFTPSKAEPQTLSAPLPPATATALRWRGPCPSQPAQQCTLSSSLP